MFHKIGILFLSDNFIKWKMQAKVPSMDKIETYNIYVGNELAARDRRMLQQNRITHILVVASGLSQASPNDFQYISFD